MIPLSQATWGFLLYFCLHALILKAFLQNHEVLILIKLLDEAHVVYYLSVQQWEGLIELLGSESKTAGGLEFLHK